VLHLAYFNAPGKPSKLENVPLEEFKQGLNWLRQQPTVDQQSLAIVGYSKGAEAALLTATRFPDVRAVVAGMPSSVSWDGLSAWSYIFGGVSSWSMGGEQLPSLAYGAGDSTDNLLPRFTNALDEMESQHESVIPVERFGGRLLLVCGEQDTLWPSCRMARMVEERARKAGRPLVRLLAYPDAGHGAMGAPLPPSDRVMQAWARLGGTASANAEARAHSWRQIIDFLKESLGDDR
jgi:dienelactone hydrolase